MFDGHRVAKTGELVGAMPAVFILPEDLELTAGPASFHRRFLDLYISQYSRLYLDDLVNYRKVLQQRNRLLKEMAAGVGDKSQLPAWDRLLIEHGSRIAAHRHKFIEAIAPAAAEYYARFAGDRKLQIDYRPKIAADETDFEVAIEKLLTAVRQRELRAGVTLAGPHRDRLEMMLESRSLRHFGSRGEKRCAMLAIKIAAADYLSAIKEEPVVLILDEGFAELDSRKCRVLLEILSERAQVFLATAGDFQWQGHELARYSIEKGQAVRQ